ncbi:ABC transporter ATP-binding protein [Amycolatopsis samaneae]|uniref:ABC transporter ATP-binding protein n=1 Tax=Amycolatopsis samaneae TaxID=664691 RepID=A0ABW5GPH6_9PSEU
MHSPGLPGLIGYIARYRVRFAAAFGCALAGSALASLIPLLQGRIIDYVVAGLTDAPLHYVLMFLFVAAAKFAVDSLRQYFGSRVALDVQRDIRTDLVRAVHRLDTASLRGIGSGPILESSTRDAALVEGLLDPLPSAFGSTVSLVVSLAVMLTLSPALTGLVALLAPVAALSVRLTRHRVFPASSDAQRRTADLTGLVNERVAGIEIVKSHAQEDRETTTVRSAATEVLTQRLRVVRLTTHYLSFMNVVPLLGQIAVFGVGALLVLHGKLSLGTLVAFLGYLTLIVGSARVLTGLSSFFFDARAAVTRALTLIRTHPSIKDGEGLLPACGAGRTVEIANVTFGYEPARPVLRELSLRAERNSLVVLTGGVGAGKSTVLDLVTRIYDADHGKVLVDGVDVRELPLDALRRTVTTVTADAALFHGSVLENISCGQENATLADVVAAAEAACADEFISAMPQGYGSLVGETGTTLSGGQSQRVALARALVRRPEVLLFDDATSAVDSATETRIHHHLVHEMSGVTRIVVTRRLSTLAAADEVFLLDDGRVVEHGRHGELFARCEPYQRLVRAAGAPDRTGTGA